MSDYNLIIQGPILSKGRTGLTTNYSVDSAAMVNYNCESNIVRLITEFGHLFANIYLITWDNEKINESILAPFKNCQLVKLRDIAPLLVVRNQKLPTDFNNKYKQFYALYEGAMALQNNPEAYTIKIRTDQYLDLKMLIAEHKSALDNNLLSAEKVFVPFILKTDYMVSDFFFVAKKEVFKNFVGAMLWRNYLEFHIVVHIEMSLKYTFLHCKDYLKIHTRTFFVNSFEKNINREKIKLQNYLTNEVYGLFSKGIIDTVIWRGDKLTIMEESIANYVFKNNAAELLKDENKYRKIGIKDFMYINIPAYIAVKLPFIRNTFMYTWLNRLYKSIHKYYKSK